MDPLDPFNIGWQRGVGRVIDNGVGMGLGVGKVLFGSDMGSALAGPFAGNVPMTPAQGLENVMHTVADQILDKRVRTRAGEGTLTFTPTTLDTDVDSRALARGQFARIRLTAEQLRWDADDPDGQHGYVPAGGTAGAGDGPAGADGPVPEGVPDGEPPAASHSGGAAPARRPSGGPRIRRVDVEQAIVDCQDIGLRTTYSPALEFGAIDVEVRVSSRELRRLVRAQQPDLTLDIGADGIIRASWTRAQRLGHVIIAAQAVDGNVEFVPEELRVSRFRLSTRRRLRTRTLTVPELPWNLRLTSVETESRTLVLRGRSDRSAGRISTITLGELPNLIRAAIRFAGRSAQPDAAADADAADQPYRAAGA